MKTSIATVSISGNLRDKLEAIAAAGYDGIEIFEQDFIAHDGSPRDVGQMVRDFGLDITLFQPFRDFEGLPDPLRSKAFDRAEHKFDVMQELGAELVLICSSCHPQALGGIDRAADDLRALGDRAKARGLRVGYEALAWGRHVNDHRDAWEILRRADHDNVGLILDSFHTLARKIDPHTIRRIPGDKIFFVQLADAPAIDMDLLYWSRHFRNMPGEGDLNITDFMSAVMATGYAGPISLEIFNDQFRGSAPSTVAKDGYCSLIALMDDVRRQDPSSVVNLVEMPPRIAAQGVSFIEFAAQKEDAIALQVLLTSLGFAKVGVHRTKVVELWQQGEVRIFLNQETLGHAGTSWTVRGTSICDIGILVDDAKTVLSRATALGIEPFSQPHGPQDLDIPAVRGLSGSVLHFIDSSLDSDRIWEHEFDARPADFGVGLTKIDHIAQTMSYEDMLSWTLFYASLFDMQKLPMVDVFDPDGLVRSQVVQSRSGDLKITLNGADTHRTLAGSFLAETFGASVQHVAFACQDIFATAQDLANRGFESLVMTANYYDDLAARFDIDPHMFSRLKAANILYDCDDHGAFFQLYSKPFANGMFFEIVQRCDAYQGFGGPNAPFRIAAQKRLLRTKGVPSL